MVENIQIVGFTTAGGECSQSFDNVYCVGVVHLTNIGITFISYCSCTRSRLSIIFIVDYSTLIWYRSIVTMTMQASLYLVVVWGTVV